MQSQYPQFLQVSSSPRLFHIKKIGDTSLIAFLGIEVSSKTLAKTQKFGFDCSQNF